MSSVMFTQSWHADAAARALETPGVWVLANVYPRVESGLSVVRNVRAGNGPAPYRPAGEWEAYAAAHTDGTAVWVRCITGLTHLRPMPETLTVRVADYGTQRGYEGVFVTSVVISSKCARCGGPRGPVTTKHFARSGRRRLWCDVWENSCGHTDEYSAVLAEAAQLKKLGKTPAGKSGEIRGVEGSEFTAAVDLIAGRLQESPWMKAHLAATILDAAGHTAAAGVVRAFMGMTGVGRMTSAKSAARYLIECDNGAHPSAAWTDGRIAYDIESVNDTCGGAL